MKYSILLLCCVLEHARGIKWSISPPWEQTPDNIIIPKWATNKTQPQPQPQPTPALKPPAPSATPATPTPNPPTPALKPPTPTAPTPAPTPNPKSSYGTNQVWTWKNNDIPGPRTTTSYAPSACGNGGRGTNTVYGYACPHQAMLTDDMLEAARFDGNDEYFTYALAGGSTDADSGICYQVQLLQAEKQWIDDFPMLVVQLTNSGFDVMPGQFDVFMGAGGFGYFTSANSDCKTNYCNGGACAEGMYDGDFQAWNNAQYNDPHLCYSGGVKWLDHTNETYIWDLCRKLSGKSNELKDRILWDSCARNNIAYLHQNFYETKYLRVRCPEGLYRISGLRRSDDDNYPEAHPENQLSLSCNGSISSGHACITTMHDNCVMSASWPGKVNTDKNYPRVDRCDRNGKILG